METNLEHKIISLEDKIEQLEDRLTKVCSVLYELADAIDIAQDDYSYCLDTNTMELNRNYK